MRDRGIYARPGRRASPDFSSPWRESSVTVVPTASGSTSTARSGWSNTRLAIVDLDGGDQPLSNESGRYWVMQNGEIYNYVELQEELAGARPSLRDVVRHRGASRTPTRSGASTASTASTATSRSPSGTAERRSSSSPATASACGRSSSPSSAATSCFASEAKALLRHPAARRELDPLGARRGVHDLVDPSRPLRVRGHPRARSGPLPALRARTGPIEERRWWDLDFPPIGERARGDGGRARRTSCASCSTDATRIRLRADVPVAAYLSGGLDSSAIGGARAAASIRETLNSFGIGFRDPRFDESAYQDAVRRALGTSLTRVVVDAPDIAELLPRAVELSEKPTLRTAPAPLLRLSGAVREAGLKVVLTGEGADELFGGYDIFRENKVRRFWARDPGLASSARCSSRG